MDKLRPIVVFVNNSESSFFATCFSFCWEDNSIHFLNISFKMIEPIASLDSNLVTKKFSVHEAFTEGK